MHEKVLLIDDDVELLSILTEIVSTKYDCIGLGSAVEALEMIKAGTVFDCIICDLMMPQMNGIQFYNQLLNQFPQYLSKIVFLSGGSFTKETDDFLKNPNIVICDKPVDTKYLIHIISNTCANGLTPAA